MNTTLLVLDPLQLGSPRLRFVTMPGTTLTDPPKQGVYICQASDPEGARSLKPLLSEWSRLGIDDHIKSNVETLGSGCALRLSIAEPAAQDWMPGFDTFGLASRLNLDGLRNDDDLLREIWLTLLRTPLSIQFPSAEELLLSVQMRQRIVRHSQRTCLNFHTSEIERPVDCWQYAEETGFVLAPGSSLIPSLQKACQPGFGDQLYSFSCSRATEYIILLAIAETAQHCNPKLLSDLQAQWETKAVQAGRFRQAFLEEFGSLDEPLPMHYYVPGDRVWFRNPDAHSFGAKGFEGSWVFYLGAGLFTNFWKRDQPFTLLQKCIEIYHWRDATGFDDEGEVQVEEEEAARWIAQTMDDPAACERIFGLMHRIRDANGVHGDGGCMDATREAPRFVLAPHCDMIEQMNDWP